MLELEQHNFANRVLELPSVRTGESESSNLPDWQIFDLCDSIQKAVQRSAVGDQTPASWRAASPREQEIRAMSAAERVQLQRSAWVRYPRPWHRGPQRHTESERDVPPYLAPGVGGAEQNKAAMKEVDGRDSQAREGRYSAIGSLMELRSAVEGKRRPRRRCRR